METGSRSYLLARERALFVHGTVKTHLISEIHHARHKSTLIYAHDPLTECSDLCLIHNKLQYFDWVRSPFTRPIFSQLRPKGEAKFKLLQRRHRAVRSRVESPLAWIGNHR